MRKYLWKLRRISWCYCIVSLSFALDKFTICPLKLIISVLLLPTKLSRKIRWRSVGDLMSAETYTQPAAETQWKGIAVILWTARNVHCAYIPLQLNQYISFGRIINIETIYILFRILYLPSLIYLPNIFAIIGQPLIFDYYIHAFHLLWIKIQSWGSGYEIKYLSNS